MKKVEGTNCSISFIITINQSAMNIFSILKKNKIEMDFYQFFHFSILNHVGETIVENDSRNPRKVLNLSPGLYHLEINSDKETIQSKIVI